MVYNYTIVREAFNSIASRKKTVEIRVVNQKKPEAGDQICFHEWKGSRCLHVMVDRIEYYSDIEALISNLNPILWQVCSFNGFDELMRKEFYGNHYGKSVRAIYFHLINVSIIMPAYNAVPYIMETLNCIEKQIYKDFELILLDDSSNDDTCNCVKSFSSRFPLFCWEHKIHKGAAELRTEGLQKAYGKYIIFLDSDDLFEPEFLAEMVYVLENSDADICMAQYDSFSSEEGYYDCPEPAVETAFLQQSMNRTFRWNEIPQYLGYLTNVPWNKMYRHSFLTEIHASFQNLPCSNDVYFSHYTMCKGRIRHVNTTKALVHYRIGRKNSITDKHDYFSEIKAYQKLFFDLNEVDQKTKEKLYDDLIFGEMKYIRWGSGILHRTFFDSVRKEILIENHWIPREYIIRRHSWLFSLFAEHDYDDSIYKVNYLIIYLINTEYSKLESLFCKLFHQAVGIMDLSREMKYLIHVFDTNQIRWIIGEQCRTEKPDVLLCTSPLQLTRLENFKRNQGISNTKTITIFDL